MQLYVQSEPAQRVGPKILGPRQSTHRQISHISFLGSLKEDAVCQAAAHVPRVAYCHPSMAQANSELAKAPTHQGHELRVQFSDYPREIVLDVQEYSVASVRASI